MAHMLAMETVMVLPAFRSWSMMPHSLRKLGRAAVRIHTTKRSLLFKGPAGRVAPPLRPESASPLTQHLSLSDSESACTAISSMGICYTALPKHGHMTEGKMSVAKSACKKG